MIYNLSCDICEMTRKHDTRCLNYVLLKAIPHCSVYGQDIHCGEICKNNDSEYSHFFCIYKIHNLIQWLGYNI